MGKYVSKVLAIAEAEVGYLEKRSNSQLDSKTANAGSGNYTKYARDLDAIPNFYNGKKNGYAWCDVFVDWCLVKAFGAEIAKKMLCQPDGSYGAGCPSSSRYYKEKGQFYTKNPKPGDQIFFWDSGKTYAAHTGLVYKVDSSKVYTIEGNTSGASGVIDNGGGVCKKSYSLSYFRIYGYGRPNYDPEPTGSAPSAPVAPTEPTKPATPETNDYSLERFIRDVQSATGAGVDGIAGPETLSKTKTLSTILNRKHAAVVPVQKRLKALGYYNGEIDGIFGPQTKKAVIAFQSANGCVEDGVITAKNKTWRKLLGMQ